MMLINTKPALPARYPKNEFASYLRDRMQRAEEVEIQLNNDGTKIHYDTI